MADAPDQPPTPPAAPDDPDRRRALSRLTGVAAACLGCAVVAGPIGLAISPLVRDEDADTDGAWLRVGPVARFAPGAEPVRVVLRADRQDAWLTRRNVPLGSVLVQRTSADDFRVFSAVCPHLGCAVGYHPQRAHFHCPCHGSAFELDGALVPEKADGSANPSPRGLDPLPWRVTAGALYVDWIRFAIGTSDRQRIG